MENGRRVYLHAVTCRALCWGGGLWVRLPLFSLFSPFPYISNSNLYKKSNPVANSPSSLYHDAIHSIDPSKTLSLTGSALFPKGPSFSATSGFLNDFVYMAIWVCVAFALGDDQNSPPGQGMTALIFGVTGYATMIALGYNTGLGISPARDIGPRLVAYWVGYGEAFQDKYWLYGPWGASIAGALVGGLMYDVCIFVGGESPVNYRWPEPRDMKWKVGEKKREVGDKVREMV